MCLDMNLSDDINRYDTINKRDSGDRPLYEWGVMCGEWKHLS